MINYGFNNYAERMMNEPRLAIKIPIPKELLKG